MLGKTVKITVYVMAILFFASTIMPAVISENFVQTVSETEPLKGFGYGDFDTDWGRFLQPEEPTVSVVVETDDGEQLTIEVAEGLDTQELEESIEEMIEGEPIQDGYVWESPGEEEDSTESDGSLDVELHTYNYGYFLEGYLTCEIGQDIYFDASDLYKHNTIMKYEWDFNGDGKFDFMSSEPTVYHSYKDVGLYVMRVKITYSYNYTYYYSGNYDDEYILYGAYLPEESSFTTVTKIKFLEYEARVSTGSKENGYPPLLDFDFKTKEPPKPEEVADVDHEQGMSFSPVLQNPIEVGPVFTPVVPIITPPSINPFPFKLQITNDIDINYDQAKKHVRMYEVTNDVIVTHIPDCVVEFDASKTIDLNGETEYMWKFGDGTIGNGEAVSHTYRRKGLYTARLRVDGWNYEHSATFMILRGYGEQRVAFLSQSYSNVRDEYLFCPLGETMKLDISNIVNNNFVWAEWDFDCDGVYEENVTSTRFLKTFREPGYYEVRVRYTYLYESYPYYRIYIGSSHPTTDYQDQEPTLCYNSYEYIIKVAVANEDNTYPPIPDFYVKSSPSFSWWTSATDYLDDIGGITLKNATYLRAFSESDLRVNSWNSSVVLNGNSSFNLNSPKLDSFTYHWDFGDGTSATGEEVSHSYGGDLFYEVTLTVDNGLFESTINRQLRTRPYSPNIYLYREKPGFETVRVVVDGTVTKAVPEIELGSEITWENVWVEDGKLNYDGESYDFLYYEELIDPKPSKFGWILERDEEGSLFLNDEKMTLDELKEFFRNELTKTGLYDHEIEDFVEEWLGEGGRLFPGETVFRYAIMYIPENIVDGIIQLETEKEYNEIIRVHFLVQPAGKNLLLEQPKYPEHKKGENVLHEWGVYTDNTIVGEEENLEELSSGMSNDIPLDFLADAKGNYNPPQISYLYISEGHVAYLLFDTPKKLHFAYPA